MALALGGSGCSSGNGTPVPLSSLQIGAKSGSDLQAAAGDAFALKVVEAPAGDGATTTPGGVHVAWTSPMVTSLPPDDDTDPDPLPDFGAQATAFFVDNPSRPDRQADLVGVLFALDPGTGSGGSVSVTATVSGATAAGDELTASVAVSTGLTGDATRGARIYAADCAACHGASGHGSPEPSDATSFTIDGKVYDFPAPGLNAEPGNLASDPDWNAALLAMASRSSMDNGGIALRLPMPDWLVKPDLTSGVPLTTQDFADIYAFLKTQSR